MREKIFPYSSEERENKNICYFSEQWKLLVEEIQDFWLY